MKNHPPLVKCRYRLCAGIFSSGSVNQFDGSGLIFNFYCPPYEVTALIPFSYNTVSLVVMVEFNSLGSPTLRTKSVCVITQDVALAVDIYTNNNNASHI